MLNNSFIGIIFEQKTNILEGIFLGLTIYSYFYKKHNTAKQIKFLKKEQLIIDKLISVMSENERYTIKEMIGSMSQDLKSFKAEVREDIKELTGLFSNYKLENNERISQLEGHQKTTTKTIAIYIGFITTFIMLAVNTYMSIK